MGECIFIDKLSKLKKSSSDSIDNIDSFDSFKKYMHVERNAENDLKDILRKVNSSNIKTLILLCGSAGDGKSHLLSYLKNSDYENLLCNYDVRNDATESNAPDRTAIETLNEVLAGFKDENIEKPGPNTILAINLGVLSNFIESEYGSDYSKLKEFVLSTNILSTSIDDIGYNSGSHFQYISFSDYHMFSLSNEGAIPVYIEDMFDKVVSKDDLNPFYASYKEDCGKCPLNAKCPVKKNYEYLTRKEVRNYISSLLVSVIIKDKEILTTRELLNYIFDILVPQDFSFTKIQKNTLNHSKYLKEYLNCIMPTLLFDSVDVSPIMNKIHKYDPLLYRNEDADDLAIGYYVAEDVTRIINDLKVDNPYNEELYQENTVQLINDDRALKTQMFNILIRISAISSGAVPDVIFKKYVQDLYSYNAGKKAKLSNLYSDIEESVTNWCGNESEGNICIDDQHKDFSLYENIQFEAFLDNIPEKSDDDNLQRFIPYIIVEFQDTNNQPIRLDVDYSLYELIYKLKKGYVQTAEDRNNHADFISFIQKVLKTGSADKYLTVISEDGRKSIIEKNKFGVYKFKVVK